MSGPSGSPIAPATGEEQFAGNTTAPRSDGLPAEASLQEFAGVGLGRRSAMRIAYPFTQSIGAIGHGRLPLPREFKQVRCHDISVGGFSYIAPEPPHHKYLVVALGGGAEARQLVARIVNCRPETRDGETQYVIGCRFIDRVG